MCGVWEFWDKILLRGEECKTREKNVIFFLKMEKIIKLP